MRMALAQFRPILFDKPANLATAMRVIADAAAARADLVVFPELFLTGYFTRDQTRALAEHADGPALKLMATQARAHRIAVAMGFAEAERGGDALYNAVCVFSAAGDLAGCYRKVHLYGEESRYFSPGDDCVVADVAGCRIGLMICFDLEFPESARLTALKGAQILVVSSANMSPFETYQETYLKARALENHAFAVVANRVGTEDEVRFFGGSGACDPFGRELCRGGAEETLLVTDLDLSLLAQSRTLFDYFTVRRPGLYGPLAQPGPAPRLSGGPTPPLAR
jgi:predicted amidohydrolase